MKTNLLLLFASVLFFSSVQSSYALFGQKRARAEAEERARQALMAKEKVQDELLALGGILIVVVVVAAVMVNNAHQNRQTIQQIVVMRTPAHEIVANTVIVDASNVIRFGQDDSPSLRRLIGLLLELHKRRYSYKCFFDANIEHILRESGLHEEAYAYRMLLRDYKDIFIEVPGRTRADDFIIDYAHNHGTPIISNDRYREYASKYPWIETDSNRRVPFAVHSSLLQLSSLGMEAKVPSTLSSAMDEYRNMLKTAATSRN